MTEVEYDDIVASVAKLNQTRQKVRAKIAGVEDELEATQRAYRNVADDIDKIKSLMSETEELIQKMDSEFKELKGLGLNTSTGDEHGRESQFEHHKDTDKYNPGILGDKSNVEELMNDVQGYARLARKIHENLQELEELTNDAKKTTKEQTYVFKEVLEAEEKIDEWDQEMERMDESIAEFMEREERN
jgi:septal ring factor EnvC (AmiA/AmiB activator)